MSKRWDACTGRRYTTRSGEQKTAWTRIGSLMENDEGRLSLKLDALPLPNDKGEVWVSFFEPREKGEDQRGDAHEPAPRRPPVNLDDSIPF